MGGGADCQKNLGKMFAVQRPLFLLQHLHCVNMNELLSKTFFLCILPISVCGAFPICRVLMWGGGGGHAYLYRNGSDSSLISQPPLQLQHGPVWPRLNWMHLSQTLVLMQWGRERKTFSDSSWKW